MLKVFRIVMIYGVILAIVSYLFMTLYIREYVRRGRLKTFQQRYCPLIKSRNLCKILGCYVNPINIFPGPGEPTWYCKSN